MAAEIRHRFLQANGLSIHCASAGEPGRPLVLFLHGFPEAWFAWEAQLQDLGRDYYAVAPDLPGYNLSDKSKDVKGYRAHVIVSDLAALVEALGYRACSLVGHDWGGALAYALAIARPELVRKLFIVNGVHPLLYAREISHTPAQIEHAAYINTIRLQPDLEQTLVQSGFTWLLQFLERDGALPAWFEGPTRERYIAAWSQPGALTGGFNYYRASPLYPPIGDDPGARRIKLDPADFQVTMPTMVLWGEQDEFLLPGCIDGLETVVPDLHLHRYAQASHWLVHEMPEVVNQRLREHLAT